MSNNKTATWETLMEEGYRSHINNSLENAELLYRTALSIAEKSTSFVNADVSKLLFYLADLYAQQHKHDLAEKYYRHALAINEKIYRTDDIELAITLKRISEMCRAQGKLGEALALKQRADKISGLNRKELERAYKKRAAIPVSLNCENTI